MSKPPSNKPPSKNLKPAGALPPGCRDPQWLGDGQFGKVYRVTRAGGASYSALKVIRLRNGVAEGLKEVKFILGIRPHPNIIRYQEVWLRRAGGEPFDPTAEGVDLDEAADEDMDLLILMELAGQSLFDLQKQLNAPTPAGVTRTNPLGLPVADLLTYMDAAADGLDHLHKPIHHLDGTGGSRVIHRDIKPANLLLVDGVVKVADYGVARAEAQSGVRPTTTISCTPEYAPPEVYNNQPVPQSDQYSLAVTYYELRTGLLPFAGPPMQAHIQGNLSFEGVMAAEQEVLVRATARRPVDRFPTCRAFADALWGAVGKTPPTRTLSGVVSAPGGRGPAGAGGPGTVSNDEQRTDHHPIPPLSPPAQPPAPPPVQPVQPIWGSGPITPAPPRPAASPKPAPAPAKPAAAPAAVKPAAPPAAKPAPAKPAPAPAKPVGKPAPAANLPLADPLPETQVKPPAKRPPLPPARGSGTIALGADDVEALAGGRSLVPPTADDTPRPARKPPAPAPAPAPAVATDWKQSPTQPRPQTGGGGGGKKWLIGAGLVGLLAVGGGVAAYFLKPRGGGGGGGSPVVKNDPPDTGKSTDGKGGAVVPKVEEQVPKVDPKVVPPKKVDPIPKVEPKPVPKVGPTPAELLTAARAKFDTGDYAGGLEELKKIASPPADVVALKTAWENVVRLKAATRVSVDDVADVCKHTKGVPGVSNEGGDGDRLQKAHRAILAGVVRRFVATPDDSDWITEANVRKLKDALDGVPGVTSPEVEHLKAECELLIQFGLFRIGAAAPAAAEPKESTAEVYGKFVAAAKKCATADAGQPREEAADALVKALDEPGVKDGLLAQPGRRRLLCRLLLLAEGELRSEEVVYQPHKKDKDQLAQKWLGAAAEQANRDGFGNAELAGKVWAGLLVAAAFPQPKVELAGLAAGLKADDRKDAKLQLAFARTRDLAKPEQLKEAVEEYAKVAKGADLKLVQWLAGVDPMQPDDHLTGRLFDRVGAEVKPSELAGKAGRDVFAVLAKKAFADRPLVTARTTKQASPLARLAHDLAGRAAKLAEEDRRLQALAGLTGLEAGDRADLLTQLRRAAEWAEAEPDAAEPLAYLGLALFLRAEHEPDGPKMVTLAQADTQLYKARGKADLALNPLILRDLALVNVHRANYAPAGRPALVKEYLDNAHAHATDLRKAAPDSPRAADILGCVLEDQAWLTAGLTAAQRDALYKEAATEFGQALVPVPGAGPQLVRSQALINLGRCRYRWAHQVDGKRAELLADAQADLSTVVKEATGQEGREDELAEARLWLAMVHLSHAGMRWRDRRALHPTDLLASVLKQKDAADLGGQPHHLDAAEGELAAMVKPAGRVAPSPLVLRFGQEWHACLAVYRLQVAADKGTDRAVLEGMWSRFRGALPADASPAALPVYKVHLIANGMRGSDIGQSTPGAEFARVLSRVVEQAMDGPGAGGRAAAVAALEEVGQQFAGLALKSGKDKGRVAALAARTFSAAVELDPKVELVAAAPPPGSVLHAPQHRAVWRTHVADALIEALPPEPDQAVEQWAVAYGLCEQALAIYGRLDEPTRKTAAADITNTTTKRGKALSGLRKALGDAIESVKGTEDDRATAWQKRLDTLPMPE